MGGAAAVAQLPPQSSPAERRVRVLAVAMNPGERDTAGEELRSLVKRDLDLVVVSARAEKVYIFDAAMTDAEFGKLSERMADRVVQHVSKGVNEERSDWIVEVGWKPGVTDNVGNKVKADFVPSVIGRRLGEDEGVYAAVRFYINAPGMIREDAVRIANRLHNRLTQTVKVLSASEVAAHGIEEVPPIVKLTEGITVKAINLNVSDEELGGLMKKYSILSMSFKEWKAVQAYFQRKEVQEERRRIGMREEFWDKPTDVELNAISQTWSEHCKHKIFNALITYVDGPTGALIKVVDSPFKTYIRDPSMKLAKKLGWVKSAFWDNGCVIAFNRFWNIVDKMESHNSPSFKVPKGGSATGIGGVIRDILATGMGAKPLLNAFYFLQGLQTAGQDLLDGMLHPRVIRAGIHEGASDYGNQMGIPTLRGGEFFGPRFKYRCGVYVRTVGKMLKNIGGEPSEKKHVNEGDAIVMIGGRVGIDGVYGAAFSSGSLHKESPGSAVQEGDPITEKKMSDFQMEARDLGLYTYVNDYGAGGHSSSIGETAKETNGFTLDLAKAPLKYQGIQPWINNISESQERMLLVVPQKNVGKLLELAGRRDVEATVLGAFGGGSVAVGGRAEKFSGMYHVTQGDMVVAHLGMHFIHEEVPRLELTAIREKHKTEEPPISLRHAANNDMNEALRAIMSRPNLCARDDMLNRYDQGVGGLTLIEPLVGVDGDVPSDASVTMVDFKSGDALAVAEGVNPRFLELDPRNGAQCAADEAYRRIIASGGRPVGKRTPFWFMDNFFETLSDVEKDKAKLGDMLEQCEGLREYYVGMGVPLVSGKDSMYNSFTETRIGEDGEVKIVHAPPPALLISSGARVEAVEHATSIEGAEPGDIIYVVGKTFDELGGSEYYDYLGERLRGEGFVGTHVPRVRMGDAKRTYEAISAAVRRDLVSAMTTPALGGLGASFVKLALANGHGLDVDLISVPRNAAMALADDDTILFSESNSRFVATVPKEKAAEFEHFMTKKGMIGAFMSIGQVNGGDELSITNGSRNVVCEKVDYFRESWKSAMRDMAELPPMRPAAEA